MSQHDATPPEGAVILGMGGTFNVHDGEFQGWTSEDRGITWIFCETFRGTDPYALYAAPEGSEVVRLNHNCDLNAQLSEKTEPETGTPRCDEDKFDCENGNPMIPGGSWVVPLKVAETLERENRGLREALEQLTNRCNEKAYNDGFRKFDFGVFPDCKLIEEAEEALAGRGE